MSIRTKLHPMGGGNGKKVEISKIACSNITTWYLTADGDLYGCGSNNYGQQGSGDTTKVLIFTKRASNVIDVVCSSHTTWYLTADGDLYGCGGNYSGQQGSGDITTVKTFTKRASNVVDVICSQDTTWYIDTSGDLYGCGDNIYGQQSSGNTSDVTTFTKRASNVAKVACSRSTTWFINTLGKLYGCGGNSAGQQGSGNTTNVKTFTQRTISGVSRLEKVFCMEYITWVISSSYKLYGCGLNLSHNQGESSSTGNITSFTQRASSVAQAFSAGASGGLYITWYLTTAGVLFACGDNTYGQQGNGNTTSVTTFTRRATNIAQIAASGSTTWYIDTSGDLYGCGNNNYGQQGNGISGTGEKVTTFTKRASDVVKVVCSNSGINTWYLTADGDLYGCGDNTYGQQGSGDTTTVTTFTKRY